MNPPPPHGPALLLLSAGLVAAAVADARSRRIPNRLVAVIAGAGWGHAFVVGGPRGLLASWVGAVVGVALLAWPFWRRYVGAGDVKLLGAIGCWVGALGIVRAFVIGTCVGGLVAILFLIRNTGGPRDQVLRNLSAFARTGKLRVPEPEQIDSVRGIPYGLALAAGAAWVLFVGVGR